MDAHPGRVLARRGFEIKTAAPRFSAVTQATAIPDNPRAHLVFDHTGHVFAVTLLHSSGSAQVDSPVVAALYKWTASGRRIDALKPGEHIGLDVRLILTK